MVGGGWRLSGVPFSASPVRKERRVARRRASETEPLSSTARITCFYLRPVRRAINDAWFLFVISSP